jgi:N-acyl-D-amino-acid deacylase
MIIPSPLEAGESVSEGYDLVISGAKIIDGSGGASFHADVGIQNGRIAKIGNLGNARPVERIDATGHVLTPGFVDIHNHADEDIEDLPVAQNYMQQGVTTIVGGHCGTSSYPIGKKLRAIERIGLGINFGLMIGQGTIRTQVMGMQDRPPRAEEMKKMKTLVREAMEEGAFGISTGLYYAPGAYSTTEELIELVRVIAPYGGIYVSHIRDESDYTVGLLAAVKEAIEIGDKGKVPVQISHLKALGKSVWGRSAEILQLVEAARDRGIDIAFDQYPYSASGTTLAGALVPRWAQEGGEGKLRERLLEPSTRAKIRLEMRASMDKRGGPEKLFVASFPGNPKIEGQHLQKIGEREEVEPVDAAIQILLSGGADVISFNMVEEDVIRIMQSPFGMFASDGSLVQFGKGVPHPRYYGTFPRVLGKYVREDGILTLEEAVRKMTSAPAHRIGLVDRGLIREGMMADITIFNPDTVQDRATFENPHQYSDGIDYVIVNGQVAISRGQWTGIRAGKVLYRRR